MMYKATRTALAILVIVAAAGAARAADDKKPSVRLKGIAVKRVDWAKRVAETTISVVIDNPGSEFKVRDVKYKLKLNGQHAAEGKIKNEVKVPAASSVTMELPVTVNLAALPAITWNTIADGMRVTYEVDAEFTVPVFAFINHRVKAAFTGEFTPSSVMTSLSGKVKEQLGIKP